VVESYISRGLRDTLLRNPHGGMAANLNAAYRNSSGDVICLLDADDTFLPGKIEAVVNAFRAHPGRALPFIAPAWWTIRSEPAAFTRC
jgi:glycosyltransferase involved in cell wall biosynthesis